MLVAVEHRHRASRNPAERFFKGMMGGTELGGSNVGAGGRVGGECYD